MDESDTEAPDFDPEEDDLDPEASSPYDVDDEGDAPALTPSAPEDSAFSGLPDEEDDLSSDVEMSLGDHIEDLRGGLIRSLLAVVVVAAGVGIFYLQVWDWIMLPRLRAATWMGQSADVAIPILMTRPFEGLGTVTGLMLKIGLIGASPVVIYEVWRFISPGLRRREKMAVLPIMTFGTGMFLIGVTVAFLYAVPLGLQFLVGFNQTLPGATTMYTMDEYTSFVTMACLGFGLAFETPLIMMALARFGLITPKGILRYWRAVILSSLVLGAVLTPPDPVTQALLASILLALFWLGYLLACWVQPKE